MLVSQSFLALLFHNYFLFLHSQLGLFPCLSFFVVSEFQYKIINLDCTSVYYILIDSYEEGSIGDRSANCTGVFYGTYVTHISHFLP